MTFSPDDKAVFPITPTQFRCVWMTAGLLSYQLCDRNFNCESCPLDTAMRMHFVKRRDAQESQTHTQGARTTSEERPYLYSRNHCWLQMLTDNIVRIGIEPILTSLLMPLREIVLPRTGDPLRQGQFNCWIIIDDDAFPLASPVTGTVLRINQILQTNPHIICTHPLTQGWIFEAEARFEEMKSAYWMVKGDAEKKFESDVSRFNQSLNSILGTDYTNVGVTFEDGGQIVPDIVKSVGASKYLTLLFEAFCHNSQ